MRLFSLYPQARYVDRTQSLVPAAVPLRDETFMLPTTLLFSVRLNRLSGFAAIGPQLLNEGFCAACWQGR
jgi:hypothetical protein